jgi:hypothetical protein
MAACAASRDREGLATAEALLAKPSIHKSQSTLLRRRHDGYVHFVKAEVLRLAAREPRFRVRSLRHDRGTWQSIPRPTGGEFSVAPDLVVALEVGDRSAVLFVEVQGTAAPLSASQEKVLAYMSYIDDGHLATTHDVAQARVLFLTFSDEEDGGVDHRNCVAEAIADVSGSAGRVLVATMSDLDRDGIGSAIFVRPEDVAAVSGGAIGATRRAGNRVRWTRDARVEAEVPKRRFYA